MNKLTLTEVLIELEGYAEDCENASVEIEDKEYTNGTDIVSIDWAKRIFVSELDIRIDSREWYLVEKE